MRDLKKLLKKFFNNYWPIFLIVVLVVAFFWKFFFLGQIPIPGDFVVGTYYPWLDYKWGYSVGVPVKNPITTDVVSFSFPMRLLGIEFIKNFQPPLWNPYILSGTPLLANFQSAPLTFTNIFYFIFSDLDSWGLQVAVQHLFVIYFTYILLRNWNRSKLSALVGGVIFAFSGFNMIWSQWNSHTLAASFIPLLVLSVDRFLTTSKKKYLILMALALTFQIFSGYPQITLYTILALGILWLVRIRKISGGLKKTFFLIVFGIVGLGMAMVQIIPAAELLSLSQRAIELNPYNWAFLPYSKIITFIAPDYFGNHSTGNYWGPQDYTSNVGFVGVIALCLAGIGIAKTRKYIPVKYATILVIVTLIFSFSTPISVMVWNSNLLGLKAAAAHRALVLWNFGIGVLAAYGFDLLVGQKIKLKHTLGIFFVFIVLVTYYCFSIYNIKFYIGNAVLSSGINKYEVGIRNLIFPTGIFLLFCTCIVFIWKNIFNKFGKYIVLFLLVFELFRFGWKYTPFTKKELVYPTTPLIEYLQKQPKPVRITGVKVIPMNIRMQYGLESPEGYDAVYPQRIAQFLATSGSSNSSATTANRYGFVDNEESPLIGLMNTKYILALKTDEKGKPSPNGEVSPSLYEKNNLAYESGSVAVMEKNNYIDRAFMVYQWETISDDKEILDTLLKNDFPHKKKVVLEEHLDLGQTNGDVNNYVNYTSYEETSSVMDVFTEKSGLLFVSDAYYPGWKAYVDGVETKILRSDYVFRALIVPEGKHVIKFEYKPKSFYYGLIISTISFCVLLLYTYKIKRYARHENKSLKTKA
jgi:uncharacterized membrane protein (UPF0136 family)